MFRNILYNLCCAVVIVSGGVAMVEDVRGMETIVPVGETVHISDRTQFFAITSEQAKDIKSIGFENQDVDYEFYEHWHNLFLSSDNKLDSVSFNKCRLFDECGGIGAGSSVSKLVVTKCGLTVSQARNILREINPYSVRSIDFSYNRLGEDSDGFYSILCEFVGGGRMSLNTLNLEGNDGLKEFPHNEEVTRVINCAVKPRHLWRGYKALYAQSGEFWDSIYCLMIEIGAPPHEAAK